MQKVAFFVDGNFMFHQVKNFRSFFLDGPNIKSYCERHLLDNEIIYRIFYYDAPPLERVGTDPLGKTIDFSSTKAAKTMNSRLDSIRVTPYMALRLGKVTWQNDWTLSSRVIKDLIAGNRDIASIKSDDFIPDFHQKLVDMKIGLDIATTTYKKLADRIVVIAGDSDFVPAIKLARKEGLHVTIDPMGKKLSLDLIEHADVVETKLNKNNSGDVAENKKQFFVENPKSLLSEAPVPINEEFAIPSCKNNKIFKIRKRVRMAPKTRKRPLGASGGQKDE